jgi:ABC-type Fe3+-hydroxamate transport system substrate-binding protein
MSTYRNRNLPAVALLAGALVLAVGLHLSQGYTGSLSMPRVARDYGHPDFKTGAAEYPRQVIDAAGDELKIARPPRRFSATDWTIEEFLYSVVPPEKIVAVSGAAYDLQYSNVYEFAERYRPVNLGRTFAGAELLVKSDPEFVIATPQQTNLINILQHAGVPVYRMYTQFTKLEQIAESILLVGYITGHDQEARKAYDDFQRVLARARARKPAGARSPRVLGYQSSYSYGSETLFHDIVETVGAINVGAERGLTSYDGINSEQVLRWNPDWIVSGANRGESHLALQRILNDPAIRLTDAARKGQILVLENNVFLPRSPFTTLIIDALGDALWGDAPEG